MSTNIAVSISADVTQLTAKLAVAKADMSATTAELRNMAAQMRAAGAAASDELKAGLAQSAAAAASAQAGVAKLRSELAAARTPMEGLSAAAAGFAGKFNDGAERAGHQAGIFREKLIMAHEALTGNYKRMAGSMMVLGERTGGLAGAFGALLSPTTLAVGAVVALGGAFYEAVASAERWSESFGQIKAAMDATGQGLDYTRSRVESFILRMRDLYGVTTTSATEMVAAFARTRDIGTESYVKLAEAAAGYARVTGEQVPQAAAKLVEALKGGYDGLVKLDREFPFLSVEQARAIHDFEAGGQKAQAYAVAIDALRAKFGPLVNDGLTPMQKSSNEIKAAWDDLTHSLGDSAWANRFTTNLAHIMEWMTVWIDGMHKAKQEVAGFTVAIPPAVGTPVAAGPQGSHGAADTAVSQEHLRILREIQDENFKLKGDDAERDRIKQELARDEEALKTATAGEAAIIKDNIALLRRQQRELNNRAGAGQLQSLRDELEQELAARRMTGEQAKQYELHFWQDHLAQVQAGSRAELEIRKQINSLQQSLDAKALSDEWQNFSETMRLKIEASKSNVAQQIALADQWVRKGQSLYGDDIKNYKAALDEKTRLLQQQIQDDRKIREIALQSRAQIAKIDLAGAPAPKAKGGGLLDQLLGGLDGTEAKAELDRRMNALTLEFKAKQAEFQDIINDGSSTPVQIAKAQGDLAAAQEQYAVDAANLNQRAAEQVKTAWENAFSPIEHAFTTSIDGMLMGTQTLQQGMRRLALSMVESFAQAGIKQVFTLLSSQLASLTAATVASQTTQTAAVTAGVAARGSASAAGAAADAATQKSGVLGHAASTAAAVYDDVAQIPYVGWLLAPPAAAAAFAAVAAFGGMIPSFDVGTPFVPRDMVAQIHQGEIIVPAAQAAGIRSGQSVLSMGGAMTMGLPQGASNAMGALMSGPSGSPASGGGEVSFHYAPTIHNGSNVDLNALLTQQGSTMRRWLSNQMRNGAFRT